MDEKRSRSKRSSRALDEGYWDCSVCTYKNSPEAFKCEMCDVRKGTSTRKPRINPQLVAQQVAQQYAIPAPKKEKKVHRSDSSPGSSGTSGKKRMTKLKNIDRSSGQSMEVTVGNVTVVITDYKPKERRTSAESSSHKVSKAEAVDSSNNTSLNSTHNDSSVKSDGPEDTASVSVASEVNGDISDEETS